MNTISTKLKTLFIEELDLEDITVEEWADDTPLFGEGIGLDSLDAVEVVVLLEKHFNVSIKNVDEGKTAMTSIATLTAFIEDANKDA